MNKVLAILLLIIAPGFSRAQKEIDSLLQVARTSGNDTVAANAYLQLAEAYKTEPAALTYFKKALSKAEKSGSQKKEGDVRNKLGIYYAKTASYSEALNQWLTCVELRKESDDQSGVAQSYNNIGILYKNTGAYSRALEYYFEALRIADKIEDDYVRAKAYGNLSIVYKIQEDYGQAEKYQLKSLELARKQGVMEAEAAALLNLGTLYGNLGDVKKARRYLDDALEMYKELKLEDEMGDVYSNQGKIYEMTGEYLLAAAEYTKGLGGCRKRNDRKGISGQLINIGRMAVKTGRADEGITSCLEGLRLADSLKLVEWEKNACSCLADAYELKGNYKEALHYHRLYLEKEASIHNDQNTRDITAKAMQYEFERERSAFELAQQRKEMEQEQQLKTNRIITVSSVIGAILMLLISLSLYRNYLTKKRAGVLLTRQKEEIERRNEEKEVLLREIHHRVKNNLQIVSSMLRSGSRRTNDEGSREDLLEIRDKVNAMALIHKKLYSNDDLSQVDFREYVSDLCETLFDSYSTEDAPVKLELEVDDLNIGIDEAISLGLILNELITNALKHAFKDTCEGKLSVNIQREDAFIDVQVIDNGPGIPAAIDNNKSFGISLVRALVQKLHATLSIESENGARILIRIPTGQFET